MKYIYFGTSEFAAIILEKLVVHTMVPIAVVTQPDRPAGRGGKLQESPVKKVVKKYTIPLLQHEKISDFRLQITDLQPDLCVIAAYGGIIPKKIIEIPKYGFLNVHPSLLPKYRGPSPIQTAILNGDEETGVSIILLDEEVDHGPIIENLKFQIANLITSPELDKELAERGAELLINTIPEWIEGKIKPKPQEHTKATFTKMMTKKDGHIDWTQSAEQIERHVRAMTPWPGSWTVWTNHGKKILLHLRKVSVQTSPFPLSRRFGRDRLQGEGTVIGLSDDTMIVVCGNGVLAIHELQPEGKKIMPASAFVHGHRDIVGAVLT